MGFSKRGFYGKGRNKDLGNEVDFLNIYLFYLGHLVPTWRSENNTEELSLSFQPMGWPWGRCPRDGSQFASLGNSGFT